MSFDFALHHTLVAEGVFSHLPHDHATKFGIPEWRARMHGYEGRMEDLDRDRAIAWYRGDFWDALSLDEVKSEYIAAELFDTAVNLGDDDAAWAAQMTVNSFAPSRPPTPTSPGAPTLVVDRRLGPLTREGLNYWLPTNERALYWALNGFQFIAYDRVAAARPEKARYFRAWMRRIGRFAAMAWQQEA